MSITDWSPKTAHNNYNVSQWGVPIVYNLFSYKSISDCATDGHFGYKIRVHNSTTSLSQKAWVFFRGPSWARIRINYCFSVGFSWLDSIWLGRRILMRSNVPIHSWIFFALQSDIYIFYLIHWLYLHSDAFWIGWSWRFCCMCINKYLT